MTLDGNFTALRLAMVLLLAKDRSRSVIETFSPEIYPFAVERESFGIQRIEVRETRI